MSKIIEVKNLSFSYDNHKIFENISFDIEEGSFVSFIDADNNGKTTLANILWGSIESSANIKILNQNLNLKNLEQIRKDIEYVSENVDGIFILENVYDNILFILKNKGLTEKNIQRRIKELLIPLKLKGLLKKMTSELSLGEKYLVAIFIALAVEPKILIFDNSFSMISDNLKKKIFELLKSISRKGITILNFTSNNDEILEGTDVLVIKKNRILIYEKIENAFNNPKLYEDNNIKLPFIIELSLKLKYYGTVDKMYYNMKELVDDIWK